MEAVEFLIEKTTLFKELSTSASDTMKK